MIDNHNNTLVVVNGTSGSGKTEFANFLFGGLDVYKHVVQLFCEDFYFSKNGGYEYDPDLLDDAKEDVIRKIDDWFEKQHDGERTVAILHGVVEDEWQWDLIEEVADKHDAVLISMVLENRHGSKSVHNVPEEDLERQSRGILDNLQLLPEDS